MPATDDPAHSLASRPRPLWRPALAGLLVLAAAALWLHTPRLLSAASLWAESGNTAAALAEGRGFSDPFVGGTGATAWIPPLFVWLEAAVFLVAGVKTAAAAKLLLALAVLGLASAHTLLLALLADAAAWARRAASAGFLLSVIVLPTGPLHVLSEAFVILPLSAALVWAAREHRRAPRRAVTLALAAVAALAPLAHAGLALATALTLAALAALDLRDRRRRAAPWLAAAAFAAALGAWTARNAAALGRFVPLKSNFWFELHLANVADPTGVPRAETVLRGMPFFDAAEFERYETLGELRYVDTFRAPALAALRADPARFAAAVGHRAFNAFVFCRQADGAIETRAAFTPADRQRLAAAGDLIPFAGTAAGSWVRIDAPPAAIREKFLSLRLDDFPGVWRDWAEKRLAYDEQLARFVPFGVLLAAVPTLALLGAALAGRGRLSPLAGWTLLALAGLLLPFVLVNHSQRHQIPLLALHALLLAACVQAWIDRRHARPAA